jgi:hypothetical protein
MHLTKPHDNLLKIAYDIKRLAPERLLLLSEINNLAFVTPRKTGMCNNGVASQHGPNTINR